MTPLTFASRHLGQIVQSRGGLGGECVDLVNLWLQEARGLPGVQANAVDWRNVTLPGYIWVPNTAYDFPPEGAIAVWGRDATAGTGPFGHIALALAADNLHLLSFDQNWPTGDACRFVLHVYAGVLGWFMQRV
jgi:hypothetical protein